MRTIRPARLATPRWPSHNTRRYRTHTPRRGHVHYTIPSPPARTSPCTVLSMRSARHLCCVAHASCHSLMASPGLPYATTGIGLQKRSTRRLQQNLPKQPKPLPPETTRSLHRREARALLKSRTGSTTASRPKQKKNHSANRLKPATVSPPPKQALVSLRQRGTTTAYPSAAGACSAGEK